MPGSAAPQSRTVTIAGKEVARIGLGTNRLTPTSASSGFLLEAAAAGIGMIDTAHAYTGGESERTIGEALSPAPPSVVIATKGGYRGRGSPDELRAQIDQSLVSLRTETIDLYYLHRVDPETRLETSLEVIASYREAGRIREVGISAVSVEQIEAARQVVPIAAVQNHYNLEERGDEVVVDHCERNGIAFVPYYPLQIGSSTALDEIAAEHDATPAQIALAWLLRRSPAMLPIPGTLSIEHLRENVAALDIQISDEEFERLPS